MQHSIGAKITELREKHHLTQAQLADRLHFTHQTISNWERGVSSPDIETVAKLAEFFNVSADELLFGKPKTQPAPPPKPKKTYRHMASEPTGAAYALKILLRVFTGLTVAEIVFSFLTLFFPAFAVFIGLIPALIVTFGWVGIYIAVLVLFLFAKEFSDSRSAKLCFFLSIAVYAVVQIVRIAHLTAIVSASDADALNKFTVFYNILTLTGLAAIVYSAPHVFKQSENESDISAARKKYFSAATGNLACTAASALFAAVEAMTVFFDAVSLILTVYGLYALSRCTADKTRLVSYSSTRPPQEVWLQDREEKAAPAVNAEAAAIACAERMRAAEIANLSAEKAQQTPAPRVFENRTKTIRIEQERVPPQALWITFGAYVFFTYIFPPTGVFNVILLSAAICAPYLALTVLFALAKESVWQPLAYLCIAVAAAAAVSTVFCFCDSLITSREPTAMFPYVLLAVPVCLNFCFVFGASLCFRGMAESKKRNIAVSLILAALSVGILVLFLILAYDPNSDPAVVLLDHWANGAVLSILLFVKKQYTKCITREIGQTRI
ncbi:MAG: hypothetical protein DBX59_06415 [Bacillota bacterium]|nr:MAG: hypothetical protein DBX59_06415 [Bacillota bacterium]